MVENTWSYLRFADEADAYCECGRMLELSEQVRPFYAPMSGHDPDALRKLARGQLPDWAKFSDESGDGDLKQVVARMEGQIAAMMAMIGGKPVDAETLLAAGADSFEAANEARLPKGIRRRSGRYEALLCKSESIDGKQHSAGSFDTLAEAEAEAESAAALERVQAARALAEEDAG
jgi:hypothetical protein